MGELKAFTIINEEWGEEADDFIIFIQLDIGEKNCLAPSDSFVLNVVSTKRLARILRKNGIETGHGYLFIDDYDLNAINNKIERLIVHCDDKSYERFIVNVSKYFRNINE